jgi:hypothetical protein
MRFVCRCAWVIPAAVAASCLFTQQGLESERERAAPSGAERNDSFEPCELAALSESAPQRCPLSRVKRSNSEPESFELGRNASPERVGAAAGRPTQSLTASLLYGSSLSSVRTRSRTTTPADSDPARAPRSPERNGREGNATFSEGPVAGALNSHELQRVHRHSDSAREAR